jgi:uncharacterized protein (DUF1778 family)
MMANETTIQLRMTEKEKALLTAWAEAMRLPLSTLVRSIALREAEAFLAQRPSQPRKGKR